jgi:DNA-binding LacI/PurR family transcriptional regulator
MMEAFSERAFSAFDWGFDVAARDEPGKRSRPTIQDVAKLAGVSIATVSRVINKTAPVAPKTVDQVQSAIADLNYRPRSAARMLASRRTNTIGLLFPEISGDFFSPLLRGIEAEARENGFSLLIYATEGSGQTSGYGPQPLGEHNTDGVLVFVEGVPEQELVRYDQIRFPVVLVHRSSPAGATIPSVTIENKRGARMLVDHLIEEHGYRRIAFLAGKAGHEDSLWREMGYRESLTAHGIPFEPRLVSVGGFNREKAQAATEEWLNAGVDVDAIFAGDDESAIGVLAALNQAGKRVPEDTAVVGFDDMYLSRYLVPPLTTVRAPIESVGREAIKQLVRLIRGEAADPLVLLPTELVIRRSCGCS